MREIRTLRAMWRGLETTHGSDTEALSTETESKQSKPNLRTSAPVLDPTINGCLSFMELLLLAILRSNVSRLFGC